MHSAKIWSSFESIALHDGLGFVVGFCVFASAALLHFLPARRGQIASSAAMLGGALALLGFATIVHAATDSPLAGVLRESGLLLEGFAVIRLGGMLVFQVVLPGTWFAPPRIVEDMITIAGYVAFAMVRLRYTGLELSGIVTTSAVITGIVALAMQDTLGNVLGGIALQLDNSLKVGDWIKIDEVNGRIVDIRWRSTSIETRNWETVVVPNSALMRGKFAILGKRGDQPEQWRRWIWFHVGYETSPHEVVAVVDQALRHAEIENVAQWPRPNCVMMDFERLAGRYAVRYWLTDLAVDDPTDSLVRQHIHAALDRSGISPFVPDSFRKIDYPRKEGATTPNSREIERRVAILRSVDLFGPLTDAERRDVAGMLRYTPFLAGDHMTEQGAIAHWLYIVTSGQAEVILEDSAGHKRHLGWIRAEEKSNFFGEMGLMTGAPRSASVIARSDIECYRLDKEAFADIVRGRPGLADDLSVVMENRRAGLELAADELLSEAERKRRAGNEPELLARIKAFFNLDYPASQR